MVNLLGEMLTSPGIFFVWQSCSLSSLFDKVNSRLYFIGEISAFTYDTQLLVTTMDVGCVNHK